MVSYQMAQKRRVRITLDMEVLSDFNPREIDFEKVFKLEPTEKVEAYIEDMDIDWWGIRQKRSESTLRARVRAL